ncbi:MAG TPA: BON domain-containing protein [Solirubrobacterales bacterium]|nr:BON domain-containing protein [Solirubrobacterales bacterium]
MRTTTRVSRLTAAAAAGALSEYFLDPDNGKRRRHVARDRAVAVVRRPARTATAEARRGATRVRGLVRGAIHDVTNSGDRRDPARLNDPALEAKVETEIFRAADSPKDSVNVNVESGVVYLRGELGSRDEIEALVEAARNVDGVGQVRSLLHLPGEQPPPKEQAPRSVA